MSKSDLQNVLHLAKEIIDDRAIAIVWTDHDVYSQAEVRDIKLSEEEAKKVLWYMDHKHDAGIGICWDVIDVWIDQVVSEREE